LNLFFLIDSEDRSGLHDEQEDWMKAQSNQFAPTVIINTSFNNNLDALEFAQISQNLILKLLIL
jgi:hypothetical protein